MPSTSLAAAAASGNTLSFTPIRSTSSRTFPAAADMSPQILERERQLLALRTGLRAKLRPMEVIPGEGE